MEHALRLRLTLVVDVEKIHELPFHRAVFLTQAALLAPQCILAGMTLSFLGLGVGELSSSWGNMFAALEQYHVLDSYWGMWAPGFVPIPVSLSYLLPANALQERGKLHRPQALRCAV